MQNLIKHNWINSQHRRALLVYVYNLQHICFSGKDPTLYPGYFAYKWERELDHLHHIAKDNGFNFSFPTHNNNGFNHMI